MTGYISKETTYKMICQLFKFSFNLDEAKDIEFFKRLKEFISAIPEEKPE